MKVLRAEVGPVVADSKNLPWPQAPEVAFVGRSNVGKSSLLNRLVGRKKLAYTSSAPGKTRLIHFYSVDRSTGRIWFVDLPGYGYAKVSKRESKSWRPLVEGYLDSERPLAVAILLQDIRRNPGEDEQRLLDWLTVRGISVLVVVTKADKIKPGRREQALRGICSKLALEPTQLVVTSSQTGEGTEKLWQGINSGLEQMRTLA